MVKHNVDFIQYSAIYTISTSDQCTLHIRIQSKQTAAPIMQPSHTEPAELLRAETYLSSLLLPTYTLGKLEEGTFGNLQLPRWEESILIPLKGGKKILFQQNWNRIFQFPGCLPLRLFSISCSEREIDKKAFQEGSRGTIIYIFPMENGIFIYLFIFGKIAVFPQKILIFPNRAFSTGKSFLWKIPNYLYLQY